MMPRSVSFHKPPEFIIKTMKAPERNSRRLKQLQDSHLVMKADVRTEITPEVMRRLKSVLAAMKEFLERKKVRKWMKVCIDCWQIVIVGAPAQGKNFYSLTYPGTKMLHSLQEVFGGWDKSPAESHLHLTAFCSALAKVSPQVAYNWSIGCKPSASKPISMNIPKLLTGKKYSHKCLSAESLGVILPKHQGIQEEAGPLVPLQGSAPDEELKVGEFQTCTNDDSQTEDQEPVAERVPLTPEARSDFASKSPSETSEEDSYQSGKLSPEDFAELAEVLEWRSMTRDTGIFAKKMNELGVKKALKTRLMRAIGHLEKDPRWIGMVLQIAVENEERLDEELLGKRKPKTGGLKMSKEARYQSPSIITNNP